MLHCFNSSVLTEALSYKSGLVYFLYHDLSIVELAIFNCHAAKVTITNPELSLPLEICLCTKFVLGFPTNQALNSPGTTPNMDENRKRHCWECLRRRVVCDSTRPACNKCSKSGSQCPGYGDIKPARLRWLPPGKVISRQQKKNGTTDPESQRHPIAMTANKVDELISPKLSMDAETSALIEAVEYCTSPLPRSDRASLI